MDMYGFYKGQILNAYEYLGAHLTAKDAVFRTFVPNPDKPEKQNIVLTS